MNFAGVQSVTIPEGDVKSIAIGGVTVWTRPFDAEIEYLESTGTQYIDSGVQTANDIGIQIDAMPLQKLFYAIGYFSTKDSSFCIFSQNADGNIVGSLNSDNRIRSGVSWENVRRNCELNAGVLIIDGVIVGSITPNIVSGHNIWVGAINDVARQSSRIYSASIRKSGVLVRSFVPVRVGQVGYLFDRVSGQLFGNAGTGDFVLGPDKNGGGA